MSDKTKRRIVNVTHSGHYCGWCRFFGGCGTEYGDYACWEFMPQEEVVA